MSDIRTAVILAAGTGTRLGTAGQLRPKGLLRFGQQSIIEESIDRLTACGVREIVIVTGHLHEFYEIIAATRPDTVTLVHNQRFLKSGSLYSLYCARGAVYHDFLLLESDLVYETRALRAAIACATDSVVLVADAHDRGHERFVRVGPGDRLVAISRDRSSLGSDAAGAMVGISKISLSLYERILEAGDRLFHDTIRLEYEIDGLVDVAKTVTIDCRFVPDLRWVDIDDPRQLAQAASAEYAAICARDPIPESRHEDQSLQDED